jgi:hypothetical protein
VEHKRCTKEKCGTLLLKGAHYCPRCGTPAPKPKKSVKKQVASTRGSAPTGVIVLIVVALIALYMVGSCSYAGCTSFTTTIIVEKTWAKKTSSNGADVYLVRDSISNINYRCDDSLWKMHWSASDVWSELKTDHKYKVHAFGWRIPAMSMYPNIYEIVEKKGKVDAASDDGA